MTIELLNPSNGHRVFIMISGGHFVVDSDSVEPKATRSKRVKVGDPNCSPDIIFDFLVAPPCRGEGFPIQNITL